MARIYFKCVPFSKEEVTLALESGVDGVIVPRDAVESVAHLSRCAVLAAEDVPSVSLNEKADEEAVLQTIRDACKAFLDGAWGWTLFAAVWSIAGTELPVPLPFSTETPYEQSACVSDPRRPGEEHIPKGLLTDVRATARNGH